MAQEVLDISPRTADQLDPYPQSHDSRLGEFATEWRGYNDEWSVDDVAARWMHILDRVFPVDGYDIVPLRFSSGPDEDNDENMDEKCTRIEVYEHDAELDDEATAEVEKELVKSINREKVREAKRVRAGGAPKRDPYLQHKLLTKREDENASEAGVGDWPSRMGWGESGRFMQWPRQFKEWSTFHRRLSRHEKSMDSERNRSLAQVFPKEKWLPEIRRKYDSKNRSSDQGSDQEELTDDVDEDSRRRTASVSTEASDEMEEAIRWVGPDEERTQRSRGLDSLRVPIFVIEFRSKRTADVGREFEPQTPKEASDLGEENPLGVWQSGIQKDIVNHVRSLLFRRADGQWGVPRRMFCATAVGNQVRFWMFDQYRALKLEPISGVITIQKDPTLIELTRHKKTGTEVFEDQTEIKKGIDLLCQRERKADNRKSIKDIHNYIQRYRNPDMGVSEWLLPFHMISSRLQVIKNVGWELQSGSQVSVHPLTGQLLPYGNLGPFNETNVRQVLFCRTHMGLDDPVDIPSKETKGPKDYNHDGSRRGPFKRHGYYNPIMSARGFMIHLAISKSVDITRDKCVKRTLGTKADAAGRKKRRTDHPPCEAHAKHLDMIRQYSEKLGFHYGEPWLDDPTYWGDWMGPEWRKIEKELQLKQDTITRHDFWGDQAFKDKVYIATGYLSSAEQAVRSKLNKWNLAEELGLPPVKFGN